MIVYNKYLDNQDYTWYDSSNVLFSKCYDDPNSNTKTLKIVFKNDNACKKRFCSKSSSFQAGLKSPIKLGIV